MSHSSVTIGLAQLRKAVNTAIAATEGRNALPILDCLRLTADAGRIVVRGTDLDVTIEAGADVEAANGEAANEAAACGDFDVAVYARPLRALLGAMPGRSVRLEQADGRLVVSGGGAHGGGLTAKLATLPVEDFPDPHVVEAPPVTLDGAQLREAIRRLLPAVSTEDTRYYLNGIYFEAAEGDPHRLLMTATNGHVMHMTAVAAESEVRPPDFILAIKACRLIERMAGDAPVTLCAQRIVKTRVVTDERPGEAPRERTVEDVAVLLAWGTQAGTLWTRDIDGRFPGYRRVVPDAQRLASTWRVEGRALRGALNAVSSVGSERVRAVKIAGGGAGAALSLTSAEYGEARMAVDGLWTGEAQDLGVNAAYLGQALQCFRAPEVEIGFTGRDAPMLIRAAETDSAAALRPGEFRAVIMPMRV